MKQRLAIAATLLKDPDLLIFDEPTNGLDPAGIREIRGTMRGLADRGKTVLVSSHILAEVEQVADTVSIIARGELIASGTRRRPHRCGRGRHRAGGGRRRAARAAGARCAGLDRADRGAVPAGRRRGAPRRSITEALAAQRLFVDELVPVRVDLESVFLELTAGRGPGTHAPPPAGEHRPAHHAEDAS